MEVLMNNGLKIPGIGLGTYLIKDKEVCKTIVAQSLRTGYRLIDTAAVYQNEEYIGEVIENLHEFGLKREDVFITTKLSPSDQGRGTARTKVLESIAKLKTPYVDLVLIHWPGTRGLDHTDPKNAELRKGSYEDLEDLHSEGFIKSIGVSNYTIKMSDTAAVYQNEEYIGEVIENLREFGLKREDVFITTKLNPSDQGRGTARTKVLESIAKLKTDYVDLVLIHWPGTRGLDHTDPKNAELRKGSYEDLEDLHSEGFIKSIGVSNYTIKHMEELLNHCKVLPAVNQVEFHPLLYQKELLEYSGGKGVVIQAYSSLGAVEGWKVLSINETLVKVAQKYQKTVPQILLKWGLQHNVCVIPKTSRVENLKPNFDLLDFSISTEDMSTIDSLNANKRFCWDPNTVL
ncbi:unnamed protein product [Oppiella nova]|uniref:NADP-dependent oxidoreductase domain-containing protein n=1 Tax=Oppiella nova TaxID=334625 RepID=A0A7R9M6K1_9ACAR|nr:unnamed protein product [Oppiella nova]CAG2170400.1 unnamed protein product [Oppiella nova]